MKEYNIKQANNGYIVTQQHTEFDDNKDKYGAAWVCASFDDVIELLDKKFNVKPTLVEDAPSVSQQEVS